MKQIGKLEILLCFFVLCFSFHGTIASAAVDLPTYTVATLPAAGTAGRLAYDLSTTASFDFGSIAANSCSSLTMTLAGAADGDTVTLGLPNSLASTSGLTFTGFVSTANTVTVKACNASTSASSDPAAAVVRAGITKY